MNSETSYIENQSSTYEFAGSGGVEKEARNALEQEIRGRGDPSSEAHGGHGAPSAMHVPSSPRTPRPHAPCSCSLLLG
jgi:hypothetical protein